MIHEYNRVMHNSNTFKSNSKKILILLKNFFHCYSGVMIKIEKISFSIGGRKLLDTGNISIPTKHKVGVVGRNGTGKTTLFDLIKGNRRVPRISRRLEQGLDKLVLEKFVLRERKHLADVESSSAALEHVA